MPIRPPRLARWLLEACLSPAHDTVVGDLEEAFHDQADLVGRRRAAVYYVFWCLRTVPPILFYDFIWHTAMLKNYLTVAVRNLRKYKGFSAINIAGLAVSMSVCLLIITVITQQKRYDRFHDKADRIHRVISTEAHAYGTFDLATSPGPMGPALVAAYPGVEQAVRMRRLGGAATAGEATYAVRGLYAEPAFFDVFDFVLARGQATTALATPFSVILTPEAAARYFGEANPLGQTLHLEGVGDLTVTGVLAPPPYKSHLQFDVLAAFSTLDVLDDGTGQLHAGNWNRASFYYNYLVLAPGAAPATVAAAANDLIRTHFTDAERMPSTHRLQALTDINMGVELSNQIGTVAPVEAGYMLTLFGLLLMLTALFNYISLSVARSLKRAREIGIRKVVGAHRGQLIRQFLTESVLVAMLALVLAAALLVWLLPAFNSLSLVQNDLGTAVEVDLRRDGVLYLFFVAFALGVGVLAGLYPALTMSGFLPATVLKGLPRVKGFAGLTLRKALTVFQFTLSAVCITFVLVVYQQFSLVMHANYGFDQEQLLNVKLQQADYETFRNEMLRHPGVAGVAATSSLPVVGSSNGTIIQAPGMDEPMLMRYYAVDPDFLAQHRISLLAGRNFSAAQPSDQEQAILLSEQALDELALGTPEDAVGAVVSFDGTDHTVIGVTAGFYTDGYHKGYRALVLCNRPASYRHAVVRIRPGHLEGTLAHLETTWKAIAPTQVLDYGFFDDQMAASFLFVSDLIKMIGFVAAFVIFITCLGLLGMASFTAEARLKEVGIRKVLGAQVRQVIVELSRDYLRLIGLAVVVAMPLAWILSTLFLQSAVNRITLHPGIFVAGVLPILVLALLTIGSQTLRAALANPADTLRHE